MKTNNKPKKEKAAFLSGSVKLFGKELPKGNLAAAIAAVTISLLVLLGCEIGYSATHSQAAQEEKNTATTTVKNESTDKNTENEKTEFAGEKSNIDDTEENISSEENIANGTGDTSSDKTNGDSDNTSGSSKDNNTNNSSSGNANSSTNSSTSRAGTTSKSTSGSNSGSSASNSGSGSSASTSHTHNWVAQTSTVHHDATYKTVHHDAEKKEVVICNGCGTQFDTSAAWAAHAQSQLLSDVHTKCGSYHVTSVVTQQAWDEQVLVQAAYDETVTTGYKCSGCGATK